MPLRPFVLPLQILAVAMLLLCSVAFAEKADRDKPMQIEADRLLHDEKSQFTEFVGHVLAVKGTLVMRGEKLQVQQISKNRQIARVWAAPGQKVFFRQKREAANEYIEGEAEQVEFDQGQDVLTLLQRSEIRVLRDGQVADRIQGPRIVYNQNTEVFRVDGAGAQAQASAPQRVRAVLVPRTQDTAPAVLPELRSNPAMPSGVGKP